MNGRQRPRELGVAFGPGQTGPRNAITDVPGVKVGHCTIIEGSGKLHEGRGPVRTGVTVVMPHSGNLFAQPVKGAYFDLNGCGGLGGALQIREFGIIETPIFLTNTMSMGAVAQAAVRHTLRSNPSSGITDDTCIPIVSECDDSYLNDSRGLHVREEHVAAAIGSAGSEMVEEGAVGAGTGMSAYDFKGGIGTSSRKVTTPAGDHVVGALVLANHGERAELLIRGVPVGRLLDTPNPKRREHGSIVMIIGTDAPLDARQLGRLARRAPLGLALTGSCAHSGSGDIAIAFSTANVHNRFIGDPILTDKLMRDGDMDHIFRATVDATEEAILNALFKADTMTGRDDHVVPGLPLDETIGLLRDRGLVHRNADATRADGR